MEDISYERKEEAAQMSIEVCVKSLHKLEALSHLQAIVLGAQILVVEIRYCK